MLQRPEVIRAAEIMRLVVYVVYVVYSSEVID